MSNRRIDWHGVFPPIVTPWTKDGDLDEDALRKVIDQTIDDGAHGILVQGCTGEWFMMDLDERYKIHAIAKEQVGDRKVWLLAGTSSVDTRQAVLVAKHAKKIGYDGHMLLAPPFVLPSERELINHYREVDKVGLPCMLYNNPERGKDQENLKPHIVEKLLELETTVALKDSTVNMPQLLETQKRCGERIANFSGREQYGPVLMQHGGVGFVAMIMNVVGYHCRVFFDHLHAKRWDQAWEAQTIIDETYRIIQGNVVPGAGNGYDGWTMVKECMRILDRNGGYMRLPYLPMDESKVPAVKKALADIGLTPESLKRPAIAAQ